MCMSIKQINNSVVIPRNEYDNTLPWSSEMLALSQKSKRKSSLDSFCYTFKNRNDAVRFYSQLIISVEYDDSIVIDNEVHSIKAKQIRGAKLEREYDGHLIINNEVFPIQLDDAHFEALVSWSNN